MPFLIVRSGPRSGERIELVGELVVGRENADLTVHDEEVSRRHLAVRPHEDGVELEDLGSTNGTFVDGARLSAVVVVSSGARVILGETELEIEVEEPEPESTRARRACASAHPSATRRSWGPVPAAPVRPTRRSPAPRAAAPARRAGRASRPAPVAAGAGGRGRRPALRHFTPAAPARRRTGAATRQWGPRDDRLPGDHRDRDRADHLLRRAVAPRRGSSEAQVDHDQERDEHEDGQRRQRRLGLHARVDEPVELGDAGALARALDLRRARRRRRPAGARGSRGPAAPPARPRPGRAPARGCAAA